MNRLYKTLFLLLFVFFGSARFVGAQVSYDFLLQAPVVDSGNGNQWAIGQVFWIEADPNFTGSFWASSTVVNTNGNLEDSVYVYGPGSGTMLVKTIDCYGDTVITSLAFDSTFTTHVADTIFICSANNANCTATFTVINTPGNSTLSFQGSSTGTGVVTQTLWQFGDGSFSPLPNPSHTYVNNGTYYVTYEVVYSTGCQVTAAQFVTVTGGNVTCSTSILPSQWGNATNFYVNHISSGSPVNFDWNFGDGQTLTTGTNGILHTYAASGTYNVCVNTAFSDGCLDSICQSMNIVVGGQGTCTAWFSHTVNGQNVSFQDATTGSSAVSSWWWDFGDGSTDSITGPSVSHAYSGQGPYVVRLEIFTNDTCYDSVLDTIVLQPQGGCSAGYTYAPDTTGQYTILAQNTSTGTNLSYFWDFGDGSTSTQAYPTHQYAGAGTYVICLAVAQSSPACADTFCDSVTITQKQAMAFTFAVWNPMTAVTDGQPLHDGLLIAPQPVRDQLHINMPRQHDGLAPTRIYNAVGQLVSDNAIRFETGKAELPVADLPNGMYILRIGSEGSRFWILK